MNSIDATRKRSFEPRFEQLLSSINNTEFTVSLHSAWSVPWSILPKIYARGLEKTFYSNIKEGV